MKFSNGCWLNKEGVSTYSPAEVYNAVTSDNSVTVYAPCNNINHRGDTLGGPVITMKLSSPIPDVIRVQLFHYKGLKNKGPEFEINSDEACRVDIVNNEDLVKLTSGNLSLRINKNNGWSMDFFNGEEKLTSTIRRIIAPLVNVPAIERLLESRRLEIRVQVLEELKDQP